MFGNFGLHLNRKKAKSMNPATFAIFKILPKINNASFNKGLLL